MSKQLLEAGLAVLAFSRKNTLSFLEDIPADKLCHAPVPKGNHALWILGHLAMTDEYFLTSLGGKEAKLPQAWNDLFGMGSQPKPDPSMYPKPSEVQEALHNRREDLVSWFRSLSDAKLLEELPDDWKPFALNIVGLLPSIAWHEGLHAGQMTVVRKSLGIAPKFG